MLSSTSTQQASRFPISSRPAAVTRWSAPSPASSGPKAPDRPFRARGQRVRPRPTGRRTRPRRYMATDGRRRPPVGVRTPGSRVTHGRSRHATELPDCAFRPRRARTLPPRRDRVGPRRRRRRRRRSTQCRRGTGSRDDCRREHRREGRGRRGQRSDPRHPCRRIQGQGPRTHRRTRRRHRARPRRRRPVHRQPPQPRPGRSRRGARLHRRRDPDREGQSTSTPEYFGGRSRMGRTHSHASRLSRSAVERARAAAEVGALQVPEPTAHPLAEAADALHSLATRSATGKVALSLRS